MSEGFHDAAICFLIDDQIYHASHSERYSGVKGDKTIHYKQSFMLPLPEVTAYYEKPFLKNLRRLYAGQKWCSTHRHYDVSFYHHESHAAAGFFTAPFDEQ